jgi:hypothetical protein
MAVILGRVKLVIQRDLDGRQSQLLHPSTELSCILSIPTYDVKHPAATLNSTEED